MRVTEDRAVAARAPPVPEARAEARSFGETLARIRGEGRAEVERRRTVVDGAPRQKTAGDAPGRPGTTPGGVGAPRGRPGAGPGSVAPEPGTSTAAPPPEDAPRRLPEAPPALPALRELVRAVPPAIDAARARAGEPLALSFGPALTIDLRVGRDGVEVTLRPDPRLFRAAAAELPGLARALAARGVRLARTRVEAALDRPDTRSGTVR